MKDIKRFLKNYKLGHNPRQRKRFIEWPVATLLKKYNEPFDWQTAQELIFIGNWYMIEAAIMLLESVEGGWVKARQSLYYHAWHMRILGGLQDQGKYNSYWSLNSDLLWLAHAMATYEDGFATWFGDRIVRSVQNKDTKFVWWEKHRFPPYVTKLYALWRGVPCEFGPAVKLDVYQQVFDRWDDDANFGEVVRALCDFHVKQASFEDGEFIHMPYDLAPFEILALLRVRRELGKPVPEVDHPLLQTPLAHPPAEPPEFQDEFLDKIIAKVRKELPIGDPW